MQSLAVVRVAIVRVLSFNQVKWKDNGGCSKHSETLAVLSSPHLYETGNVVHCPFYFNEEAETERVQSDFPKNNLGSLRMRIRTQAV